MTVSEALGKAAARLAEAGVVDPALDAERLLRHVLECDRAAVISRTGEPLTGEVESRFLALVAERARRRPLQHLTSNQAFWRHDFLVTPDVLIPRPETELIVEAALGKMRGVPRPLIVDVGTGSGCIAVSLAAERPDGTVHAIDISGAALALARENARRAGVAVVFHQGDLLAPVEDLAGRIDLVASNPPYIDASEMAGLAPEVRDHEPWVALVPPGDRYSLYRRLAPAARRLLRPGGWLVVEIGQGMHVEVARLCTEAGFQVERVIPDLQGISRTVVAAYPAAAQSI